MVQTIAAQWFAYCTRVVKYSAYYGTIVVYLTRVVKYGNR